MPTVRFTANLQRHVSLPVFTVEASTVREALAAIFASNPDARGYILDDQSALRKHMVIFVDSEAIRDRTDLSDPVRPGSEIYVMQALSGG